VTDVAHELVGEVFHRGEDTPRNDVAFDLAKPQFDLIEPRRIGGGNVQPHVGVLSQEVRHSRGLVRREIIGNHMNLFAAWLARHDVGQKGDELLGGMAHGGLSEYFAGLGIEGCVERQRAVPVIFEPMPFCPPRRQRQHGILAVEGLDRRFLVNTKHCRLLRRVQVEADDVSGLALELRVVGRQIALQPVGLDPMLRPDSCHSHMTNSEVGREFAGTPVR